ncbi:MAG: D-alanine--D-alanine ligase family protein [Christensenellales bacterium]
MKKNVFVFFGGKSAEHDISIITAIQTLGVIDSTKYQIFPAYIDKNGLFYTGEKLFDLKTFVDFCPKQKGVSRFVILDGQRQAGIIKGKKIKRTLDIDFALLCCHGAGGEDGCLQGLLEMSDIPYSSCGVCSSAVCMNKKIMKDIFLSHKIPIVKHIFATRQTFEENKTEIIEQAQKLGYPLIIKPANSGSSIGISKCHDQSELEECLNLAFNFDKIAIIEKCVENLMEINCAVLKVGEKILTSTLEEPKTTSDILTFDDKYLSSPTKGEKQVLSEKDIKLKKSQKELIKALAKESFVACDCDGVVRIDFMIDLDTQKIYVNEINTIPGSLSNHMFDSQMTFSELVDNLISSAISKNNDKHKNAYHYSSPAILSYLKSNTKQRIKLR